MKKIIFTLIFASVSLFATDTSGQKIKAQILEKILLGLNQNQIIRVWSDNKDLSSYLNKNKHFIVVNQCEASDILIIQNQPNIPKECKDKKIFVLNYDLLSKIPNSFGALFWKKGRPNIVLLEPRIKKSNLKISKELQPYLEERIW